MGEMRCNFCDPQPCRCWKPVAIAAGFMFLALILVAIFT